MEDNLIMNSNLDDTIEYFHHFLFEFEENIEKDEIL